MQFSLHLLPDHHICAETKGNLSCVVGSSVAFLRPARHSFCPAARRKFRQPSLACRCCPRVIGTPTSPLVGAVTCGPASAELQSMAELRHGRRAIRYRELSPGHFEADAQE